MGESIKNINSLIQMNPNISEAKSKLLISDDRYKLELIEKLTGTGYWEFFIEKNVFWGSITAFQILGLDRPSSGFVSFKRVISHTHKDDRARLIRSINDLLAARRSFSLSYKVNRWSKSGNKEIRFVKSQAEFINEENQLKITGTITDITSIKKHERELIKDKEKAERQDRMKSSFLANMSHEIRTPMNAIIGFSELLNIGDLTPQKKKEFSTIIKNKGKVLLTLIDDIIELAKFEGGKISISNSAFDLLSVIKELQLQFGQAIEKQNKSIDLRINIPAVDSEYIIADPGRLQQIMANLLTNALKYTQIGKIEFGYEIQKSEKIIFFVSDTGVGIPKEKFKLIFDRFTQLEEALSDPNSAGLGLTVSKEIIELMHGKIWVESEVNKGSTFYFSIPYEKASAVNEDVDVDMESDSINYNWKNKVIVVVEDEEINYKFIETVLQETQAQVIKADNGLQALKLCESISQIDMILMDIKMSGMSGYEATKRIKGKFPKIPIIAQTALTMNDEKRKCFEAGCNDYISKPLDIKTLLEKINVYFN